MIPIGCSRSDAFDILPLSHSWPLGDLGRHFELGLILNSDAIHAVPPPRDGALSLLHSGSWECDLSDNSLTWSGGVFDIFGLPRNAQITRHEAASFYAEASRISMEHLR